MSRLLKAQILTAVAQPKISPLVHERLSTRTVREYLQRGDIEGRIIGGRWRFRSADLDAFFTNAPREWDFARKNGDED